MGRSLLNSGRHGVTRSHGGAVVRARCRNVPFCNKASRHPLGPLSRRPQPVSEINVAQARLLAGCATRGAWRICWATPGSPLMASTPTCRWMRCRRPAATGSSWTRPAAPWLPGRRSTRSSTSCARAIPWWCGSWIGWAGRCATWSTPLPPWPTAASGSGRCRSKSTPPPRAASWCSTSLPRWPSSNATWFVSAPAPDWPPPGLGACCWTSGAAWGARRPPALAAQPRGGVAARACTRSGSAAVGTSAAPAEVVGVGGRPQGDAPQRPQEPRGDGPPLRPSRHHSSELFLSAAATATLRNLVDRAGGSDEQELSGECSGRAGELRLLEGQPRHPQ